MSGKFMNLPDMNLPDSSGIESIKYSIIAL